jgi:hypothetical protein
MRSHGKQAADLGTLELPVAQVMSAMQSPPIAGSHRPAFTYFGAILLTVPALILLFFSIMVHLPRLERLWAAAGIESSRAQWIMDACRFVPDNFYFIGGTIVLLLAMLEGFCAGWPRWRRTVLFSAAFLFQITVMLELAFVTTASQLAVSAKVLKPKLNP